MSMNIFSTGSGSIPLDSLRVVIVFIRNNALMKPFASSLEQFIQTKKIFDQEDNTKPFQIKGIPKNNTRQKT